MLPNSIGKLHNLLTLDLKHSLVQELPIEISSLRNLQYLVTYSDNDNHYSIHSDQGVKINGSVIRNLESLERLYHVDFQTQNGGDFISDFGRLSRLRKLGITKLKSGGMALCDAIEKMRHLQSLHILAAKADEFLQLQSMSSPPLSLERVRLQGRLGNLPDWISKLKNLVKISLHWSSVSDDSLKILGCLPNLLEFWLYEGNDVAELHFKGGHFKKLKQLALRKLQGMKKLTIDEGSLSRLEILIIGPSPHLQEVPANICNLNITFKL
ncbi:hypothetical protein REPUB_Repub11eG0040400 [Reevesia pubescens]